MIRTLIAAAVTFAATPALAGTAFDIVITNAAGEVVDSGQIKADGRKLAMTAMAGQPDQVEGSRMIFRGDLDPAVLYVIDDAEASYVAIRPVEVAQGLNAMQSRVQSMMNQAMRGMTPEQRAQMEAAMGGAGGGMSAMMGGQAPEVTIRPTGQTLSVDGAPTTGFEVLENGQRTYLIWAAPPGAIHGGDDLAAGFGALADTVSEMPQLASIGAIYDLDALQGRVPVQIEEVRGGAVVETTTIGNGETVSFPASDFEPDPAYAQRQMFEALGGL